MSFLKSKTTITITVPLKQEEADKVAASIEQIANNLSVEEIQLLARAVKDPIIKFAAVAELKKRLT